jgi:hypothetical protein
MSANWAKGLAYWKPHYHSEEPISLTHLHPFRFDFLMLQTAVYPELKVEIRVGFSHHTFTRDAKEDEGHLPTYVGAKYDKRIFCPKRYELSKRLPKIVRGLDKKRCYIADRNNYFVVDLLSSAEVEYRVYFDVRNVGNASAAVKLFVQSAYVERRDRAPNSKKQKTSLAALVIKAL